MDYPHEQQTDYRKGSVVAPAARRFGGMSRGNTESHLLAKVEEQ